MKIIEVIGSPDSGKTTALRSLSSYLNETGITAELIIETRGKDLFPKSERGTLAYNCKVGRITCERIRNVIDKSTADIVLIDKGYVDYLLFTHYYLFTGKCSKQEAEEALELFKEMRLMPDILVAMTCNPEVAALRCKDAANTRTVKVQKNIDCLMDFYNRWNRTSKHLIDTSYMSKEAVVEALKKIL